LTSQQIAHYRIIQKLGAGGMGEVFLAQDTKLERKVAIKMLPAKSIDDAQARRRLVREARAAATLDHPNICAVHEVNEDAGCVFIVMQYVEGENLAEKLLGRQLSTDEVLDIGIQVGEALSEAHSRGVIHRDIKPSNVVVTPRGQVKVLDFGLARVTQIEKRSDPDAKTETQLTEEGHIVGTVAYMSPEQLKGLAVDSRSDIFSLGVLLYECAAGAPPFAGNSKVEISSKVLQVDPRKPSELNPRIPPLLETIILKAMAKDAADRYQSVDEVIHDLKGVRASLSGATELLPSATRRTTTTSEIPGSPLTALRSRNVQVGLAVAAVAIIGTLIALGVWRSSPYQPVAAAKPYYEKGVDAIHAGTYFQASKLLKQSVDLDSQYAPAHARLGEAYLEIGNTEQAKDELLAANALAGRRNLAKHDKLQLDAIDAMVRHDFGAAIAGYQTISDQSTTPEKAEAHVDLGRAYERNEQLDKAIENYLKATNEDPQSAGAFLHLGIASGRKHDADNAERAFKKAEEIYKVLTNNEGQVEVEFQRGMLFYGAGKLAEAKAEFEKVLEALKSPANPYQLTRTELALSLVYRDEGNLERAKQMATDAIRVAQMSDIKNVATNGLIDLGLAFMSNGAFDEAGNYFQQALDLARRDRSTATEMKAHLSLGRLAFQRNDNDTAIAELQTALNFYQPAKYLRETSIAMTVLGRAYQDKGDNQTALKLFEEQAALAKQADDASGVSDSHMSLAILLGSNEEKYTEALAHLDEKLSNDEARHSKRGMASDQMNRARFLSQLGRYDDARAALDAAYDLANDKEAQLKPVLAWVHLIRARVALSQAQYAEAKKEAQLASDFKFSDVTLQADYTSGLAQALSGSLPEGRKLCEEAFEAAEKLKSSPLTTSAQLALAEVMLLQKDSAAALDNALQLEKVFAQSGQQDSEWRALLIAARASDLAGNKTAAREYAARAAQTCNALQQRWGAEAYQNYLKRPDIQMYQKQLADLLKT
jgi:serine/threonine protein kinase/tetratricopeptide (TPR) repeat protein